MTLLKKDSFLSILIFMCGLLMPFILYWDLFISDKLFFSGDGIQYLSPIIFERNALLDGEFPFWNPFLNNGIPFISDISMGPFYLPTIILSFLPVKLFVYIVYGFHVALASFFSFKFFRALNCEKRIAFASAFLYIFSVHLGGFRKEHMVIISAVAYTPAIMYAIESFFINEKKKYLLLCSLFLALQFFAPFVQLSAYTFGTASIYFFLKSFFKNNSLKKSIGLWSAVTISYLGLIAIQLLPTLEMLSVYRKEGVIPTTMEYFKTYSISLNKLLMMAFPNWFNGNIFEAGGFYKSSGMDIELFCGACVFVAFVFAIVRYIKNSQMKIFVIMMTLTLVYAAHGNIPYLSNLLFLIPGINGFRCPARILFLFIFFVYSTFAYGLNCCLQRKEFYVMFKYICVLAGIMLFVSLIRAYYLENFVILKSAYTWYKLFGTQILSVIVLLLVMYFSRKQNNIGIILATITIVTLVEIVPYNYMHRSVNANEITLSNNENIKLQSDLGNNKIWDAFKGLDGMHTSFVSQNKAMSKKIPAINAYIPFNIPTLYKMFSMGNLANFNYSGLTTGSLIADKNIHLQNQMLSILGIKYIIDSSEIIKKDNYIDVIDDSKSFNVVSNKNFIMDKNPSTTIENIPVSLISHNIYRVEFDYELDSYPQIFNADLFGGANYDYPEAQVDVYKGIGKHHVIKYINSGFVPKGLKTYIRLISYNSPKILISNFSVDKCYVDRRNNFYQFYKNIDGQDFYLNPTYKEILYTTPMLIGKVDKETIYSDVEKYKFLESSYVEDDVTLINNNADIRIIDRSNNAIKANVTNEKDCFVNFSQNYYPGWHAYVNGKETKIHLVNGIIQGVILPKGNNVLEFKYIPTYLKIGFAISLISLLTVLIGMWRDKGNNNFI